MNGQQPYTWTFTGLPASCQSTPNTDTALLTCSFTATGSSSFSVTARDASGNAVVQQYSLSVTALPASPAISTTKLSAGQKGTFYATQINATGGALPLTWQLASGTLPNGLAISSDGILLGTPNQNGAFSFTLQATDAASRTVQKNQSLTLADTSPISIGAPVPLKASKHIPMELTFNASGGKAPYTWAIGSGSNLPGNLTLADNGILSGITQLTGTYPVSVVATDYYGKNATFSSSLAVGGEPFRFLYEITPSFSLNNNPAENAFDYTLAVSGGTPPYSFQVTNNTLPAGLALAATTGRITGNPTTVGAKTVEITASDSASPKQTIKAFPSFDVSLDTTPDLYSWTPVVSGKVNTIYTSTAFQVAGINAAAPLEIENGEFSINNGAWTSTPTTVKIGDTIEIRVTTGSAYDTLYAVNLIIGGEVYTYTVETGSPPLPVQRVVPSLTACGFVSLFLALFWIGYRRARARAGG